MACGVCGDPGHNRRTHSAHEPVQGEALIDQPATGEPVAPTGADRAREALRARREVAPGFLDRGGRLVGESGPEPITLEQARQLWPDRVVEGDGWWSVEAITVQGVHGPGASVPADAVQSHDDESADWSDDDVDEPPSAHECEPAPDQVYFCRHCGADLMTVYQRPLTHVGVMRPGAGEQGPQFVPWRTVLGPDEPIRITLPGVYDLTAEQYHDVNVTGDWLSNSDVKKILQTCPAQFQYDRWNGVRKTSDAFDFGHVWHARVLGKGEAYQVFEPKKLDGRTKEGKAQRAEVDAARAAGITPIYGDQFALIEAMAQAVEADPIAIGLMSAPGRQEVCLFWTETVKVTNPQNSLYGQMVTVKRRAMIDHLPDMPDDPNATVTLVDGKTADEVKPDDNMRKKIYDYGYHRQADTYAAGVEALFNRAAEVVFLFQSKKPPHLIVPVDLDTPAMLVAAAENRQVMEVWGECVATGNWPGYTKGIATSGVPAWIERQFEDEMVIG